MQIFRMEMIAMTLFLLHRRGGTGRDARESLLVAGGEGTAGARGGDHSPDADGRLAREVGDHASAQ